MKALHALAVNAAIGHQRAGTGQADLAAVGVARQRELVAVVRELLQHAGLGGMEERQGQVGVLVGRAGDFGVVI